MRINFGSFCGNLRKLTFNYMNSAKIIAIITGAISILIAVAYLILVQILDFRTEMIPAPLEVIFPRL